MEIRDGTKERRNDRWIDRWIDRGIDKGRMEGVCLLLGTVDRLSRASINRIVARRTEDNGRAAMHGCVDPPPFLSSEEN